MSSAVLVAGYEKDQYTDAKRIAKFLRRRTNIRDARVIPAWNTSDEAIESLIAKSAAQVSKHGLLVVYVGAHGSLEGSWSFEKGRLSYHSWFAEVIGRIPCRVLVINDSCHGGCLAEAFGDAFVNPSRVGLIAASSAETVSFRGDLTAALMYDWDRGQVFRPRVMHELSSGGPPLNLCPPVWTLRKGNPLLYYWDFLLFRIMCLVYRAACRIWPYRTTEVRSERWGAVHDALLWRRRRHY